MESSLMFIQKTNLSEELTKKHQLTIDWHSQSPSKVNTFDEFLRVRTLKKYTKKKRPPCILSTFISVMTWMVGNIWVGSRDREISQAG